MTPICPPVTVRVVIYCNIDELATLVHHLQALFSVTSRISSHVPARLSAGAQNTSHIAETAIK